MIAYFIPRHGGIALLDEAGLRHIDRNRIVIAEVGPDVGPERQSGTVFHRFPAGPVPDLKWTRALSGEWWFGWHPAQRPTPEAMSRVAEIGASYQVRLADDALWYVPIVLPFRGVDENRTSGLPRVPAVIDGEFVWQTKPGFERLVDLAEVALKANEGGETMGAGAVMELCAAALGVCYRVTVNELLALGLIDSSTATRIAIAVIDAPERYKDTA